MIRRPNLRSCPIPRFVLVCGQFRASALLALVACTACNGCTSNGAHPSPPPGAALGGITVTSKAFSSNGAIPVDHTCDGVDRSPPLTWSAPPQGTRAIGIVVDDPDAPGGDFTHWLAYDLAPTTVSLSEGADVASLGGTEGLNGFGRVGYAGPCPPRGEVHRYYYRVYALNAPLAALAGASREAVDRAMNGHVLAEGSLVGTFGH
jgi:Raf kinase inhibitor-like YbhB/YbcL family protein